MPKETIVDRLPIECHWFEDGSLCEISLTFEMVGGQEPTWTVADSRYQIGQGFSNEHEAVNAFHELFLRTLSISPCTE